MLLLGAGHRAQIPLGTALTTWDPEPTLPNLQFPTRQRRRPRGVRRRVPTQALPGADCRCVPAPV